MKDTFGIRRVMEPKGAVPVMAWKLDNRREIGPLEARLSIEVIHFEKGSFRQICSQCDYDESKMIQRIMDIVDKRGKLHNPFTDTGGNVYGRFEELGSIYAQNHKYKVGDEFLCLVTLTAIPIFIEEIVEIDFDYEIIKVKGYAILFENSIGYNCPVNNDNIKYTLAALEEGGAFYSISNLVEPETRIAVIAKDILSAVLYSGTIRNKLKGNCHISIILDHDTCEITLHARIKEVLTSVADDVFFADLRNPVTSYINTIPEAAEQMDFVINTEDKAGAETISVFMCKDKGKIYFTGMKSGYSNAILIAESMKKEIHTISMEQYFRSFDEFTFLLLSSLKRELDLVDSLYKDIRIKHKKLSSRSISELEIKKKIAVDDFIYASSITESLVDNTINIAKYDCNVIIQGETGVGKEKILQIIQKNSERNKQPCIKVNCATIQENLAESEFFGYEKGAFTGAQTSGKKGYFELANNGILFLDEIGSLSMNMQSKMLRVLQEKQFYKVGGTKQIDVDVRVICANNIPLFKLVQENRFREDLYYRLNICQINVPPLRERKEDIRVMANAFIARYNKKYRFSKFFDEAAIAVMEAYDWPGNVRELENAIHRMVINTHDNCISKTDVEALLSQNVYDDNIINERDHFAKEGKMNFDGIISSQEKKLIEYALKKERTTRKAATALGITQARLMRLKGKYGL